jgi:hypothetical protein
VKLCGTIGAAAWVELPAWLASIVHVPATRNVADVPETVQTEAVVEVKPTTNPELDVAESVRGRPTRWVPGLGKVMVWETPATTKLCGTIGAAA